MNVLVQPLKDIVRTTKCRVFSKIFEKKAKRSFFSMTPILTGPNILRKMGKV